jgi:SMODS-associating 2TM, beta-strand rich effector domain
VLVIAGAAVIIVWALEAGLELLGGGATTPLKWVSFATTIVVMPLAGAVGWLWRRLWRRYRWLERNSFPDLTGQWEGHIKSTWRNSEGATLPPIPVTMLVRQGLFFISLKIRTSESSSHSTRTLLEADRDAQRFRVWYSYDNRPDVAVSHRSSRHEGVAWLEMDYEKEPDRLAGQYFTDRRTTGDIEVRRVSRNITSP